MRPDWLIPPLVEPDEMDVLDTDPVAQAVAQGWARVLERDRRDLLAAAAEARAAGIALELVFDARDRARRSGRSVAEAVRCAHRERH